MRPHLRPPALLAALVAGVLLAAPTALAQDLAANASNGATDPTRAPEAHVRLSWTPTSTPGERYQINRARLVGGVPEGDQVLAVRAETVTEYFDATALPGVSYRYCVRAMTSGAPPSCATGARVLRGPATLTASDSTRTGGTVLEWVDRSTVELGYVVFRGDPAAVPVTIADLTPLDTTTADATTFVDETGVAGEPYRYCVGLLDGSGGVLAVAEPLACDVGAAGVVDPPAGVVASDGTIDAFVRVSWAAVPGVTYTVYRESDGAARLEVASELAGSPYEDATAAAGATYTYCVTAVTDAGESVPACDAGRRGSLAPPTAVAASDGTSDSVVELTWTDPGPDETGFRIYRRPAAGGDDELVATLPLNRARFADPTAVPEVLYTYCVEAVAEVQVDGGTAVSASERVCDDGARSSLLAPTAFSASDAETGDEGSVQLAWGSESDVVQLFLVLRDGTPIATLEPFARSYRDATGLSGTTYDYAVQSMAVVDLDPARVAQGLAPILRRASAQRLALAADRGDAREAGADALARHDARAADAERAVVREVEALLAAMGADVDLTAARPGDVVTRASETDPGSRRLRAPGAVAATTDLEDRIRLTWADRSEIETDYQIRAHYGSTDPVDVLIGPNRTGWVDVGAPAGHDVRYLIRTLDRDPDVAQSVSEWVEVVGRRDLLPPGRLRARQMEAEDELLVTWRDSSRAETGYVVTADLAAGVQTFTAPANARQSVVPIQPEDFGRAVTVTVRAVAPLAALPGVTSESETRSTTVTPTLLAPRVVTASTDYTNQVVVSWTDDSGADTGYVLSRNGTVLDTVSTATTTFTDRAPIGTASYCVVPLHPAGMAAQPDPVCRQGRVSTSTLPSTGDVVTTPVVASDLDAVTGSAGFGAALAAEDGLAAVGASADAVGLPSLGGNAPSWMYPFDTSNPLNGGRVVGGTQSDVGAVSAFARSDNGWVDEARIQVGPNDPFRYGRFGEDVDLRGNVALIGAPGPATFTPHPRWRLGEYVEGLTTSVTISEYVDGGAYLYTRDSDGEWRRLQALRAYDWPSNEANSETTRDRTGGETLPIEGLTQRTVFQYQWVNRPSGLGGEVTHPVSIGSVSTPFDFGVERLGERVALTSDWAFVSFVEDGTPRVGFYQQSEDWAWQGFVEAPAWFDASPSGDGSLDASAGALALGSGADERVHLHEVTPTAITAAPVTIASPAAADQFGAAVAVEGDLLAVGAPGQTGAAYLYRKADAAFSWALEATLLPDEGDAAFGTSVAIANGFVVVGAESAGQPGVVYTFRPEGFEWIQASRLTPDVSTGASEADRFGAAVASSEDDLIIGAPGARTPDGAQTGAVYFATVGVTPSDVAASDGRYANRIQVRWEDEAAFEDGYRVYRRGPADADYVLVGTLDADLEVFDDFDVAPGSAYSYCVASFLGEDESDTNPLGESGRACDAGYTPPNGTITGRLATGEGAAVIGTAVCLAPGLDQALMLDGLGGRAAIPAFGTMPGTYTLEAWVNGNDFDSGDFGINSLVGIERGISTALLRVGDAGIEASRLQFVMGVPASEDGPGDYVKVNGPLLETERWYHVAGTYDGATMRLYVDGEPVASGAMSPGEVSGPFQIGQSVGQRHFHGRIDDVRLWSRALTEAEVAASFAEALPLEGDEVDLHAYWAVDQGDGRVLTDLTEGGRHAILRGGAEWTREAAPLNTCAVSDGSGNYTFDGLRYGETTSFAVTPTDSTRQFTPGTRTATLTPESPTENQMNFTDVSSYTVRGTVVHAVDRDGWNEAPGDVPAALPASDVDILVDGTVAGTTESDGTFSVAVRGAGLHEFEARGADFAFSAALGDDAFPDGTATVEVLGDVEGLTFTNGVRRTLRGVASGGCERPIGAVTFRVYTEDRRFDQTFTSDASAPYALSLPPLPYRLEYVEIGTVPDPLNRAAVVDYFRNLGVLQADLTTEADTVDFRYRAPITLVVGGLGDPPATCAQPGDAGYTVVDADGVARQTLPAVPVIEEYARLPLTIRAYEDYGDGNRCAVDAGTVRIFDGFADAADEPVELELDEEGEARYTTFGRSPDTFSGRTVDGVDRSYQKSLSAVLEVPDGPSVTETVWAIVEGYREKPSTFVTATMSEIPVLVLRDPPGSESSAYVEAGSESCVALSQLSTTSTSGGAETDLKIGFKAGFGFVVAVENGAGVLIRSETVLGRGATETTGPRESNMRICAAATERWETSGDAGWSGEDLFTGVGLNVIFAEVDVVAVDPAECTVDLSTTNAADLDDADPFATTFVYGETHIRDTLIPQLEGLARSQGEGAGLEGEPQRGEAPPFVTLRKAIQNWEGMLALNDSLVAEALAGEVENRSFSGGSSYEFGTASDTTWTSSRETRAFFSSDVRIGGILTAGGYDNLILGVVQNETESTLTREAETGTSYSTGYTLADGDAGDYFSVDVAQDPVYGTYVFDTVSGASSNPWEPGTQRRDLPRLVVDPPVVDGVVEGERAVFTASLTNASESDERREYVLAAPAHLNPAGAVIRVNGAVLEEKRYTVDPNQTISIPVTVERGPEADDYALALVTYAEADLHRVAADTARFEVSFVPTVAPVRLLEPEAGWAVTSGAPSVRLTLTDLTLEGVTGETVGVEYRRGEGPWETAFSRTGDLITGPSVEHVWTPPAAEPDGAYELRAFARRSGLDPAPPPYVGPAVAGVVDRTAPRPFGPPEPADQVLALGEAIGLTFEEPIDCVRLRGDLVATPEMVRLFPETGEPVALDVGCVDRSLLLAPQDPSLWTEIEGQRVTARVRGVRDLAGNPMARPEGAEWDEEWSFTVRRNAFGWTPAVVTVRAQPGAPAEVPAALVNGRAQPVSYTLAHNNADFDAGSSEPGTRPFVFSGPDDGGLDDVYLTASGYSGTVVSGDVQPVVFRWPGAPVGTYTSRVGVRSAEAGDSLAVTYLDLTVDVSCTAPDWLARAAAIAPAFETTMTVTAALWMGAPAVQTDDPDDLLAAFVDGELRGAGAAGPVDTGAGTVGLAELIVYGTGAPERVVFQAWDQDACTLHRTTSRVAEFVAGGALGRPAAPLRIDAPGADGAPLEVPLAAGWTWVSTNREGTSPLGSALVGVGASENDLIQSQRAFSRYVPGSGWTAGLPGMTPGAGYHIFLDAPATMTHAGALVDPTTAIGLLAGWNWIGFLPGDPLGLDEALASVTFATDDAIKSQREYATYVDGVGWVGSLSALAPGVGYHLFVADDAELLYPTGTSSAAAPSAGVLAARPVRRLDGVPERREVEGPRTPVAGPSGPPARDPAGDPSPTAASGPAASVSVEAPAHEHSMIVTATLDGAPEGLHVAAYAETDAGPQLRGLAPVEAVDVLDGSRVFLLVGGEPGEPLVLRPVLLSEAGELVPVGSFSAPDGLPGADGPTAAALPFVRDAIVGTAASPVALRLSGATSVDDDLPTEVALAPTRPNPTSGAATFGFALPEATAVRLVVYDVLGREVAVLADGDRPAGRHEVRLGGRALASGTYIARLTAGPEVRTRTFTVAR